MIRVQRDARRGLGIVVPALLVAVLTLHRLDAAEVCETSEGVEGVFLQQMVEHDHLLFPVESGRVPMYKPPLFHWTAVAVHRLAGIDRVTAWSLRLTSAMYAVAGTVLATAIGESLIGPGFGSLAGLILAGSYQYIHEGRSGTVNMTLTFYETLALCAFLWWIAARRGLPARPGSVAPVLWHYVLAAGLGLGVLAKGPVGMFLPLVAMGALLAMERRWDDAAALIALRPALLAVALGLAWYLVSFASGQSAVLLRQLGSENFGRFYGTLGSMPSYYYVENLLLTSVPFSLLTPLAVVAALRPSVFADRHADGRDGVGPLAQSAVRLFAIFWIVTLAFFSFAAYKRRVYILPLSPASAVLFAWWLRWIAPSGRRWIHAAALVWLGAVGVNFFYIPHREIVDCGSRPVRSAASAVASAVPPDAVLSVCANAVEVAPLLFYLDRDTIDIEQLRAGAPGYAIVSTDRWAAQHESAPEWSPLLTVGYKRIGFVIARR